MIALFHVLYWTCHNIYNHFQDNVSGEREEESSDRNLFGDEVKFSDFSLDAEEELRFDPPVYRQRYSAVQEILLDPRWRETIVKVVEYGCAEMKFFTFLKHSINIQEILFVDIDEELLRRNSNRIQPFTVDYLDGRKKPLHVGILQGSIDSPDVNVISANAVICIEIIEHLYPDTLDALPHNIFYFIEPSVAIFTTPNADFNILFKNFSGRRHEDHKFEWTRAQFEDWANNIVIRYPKYSVNFYGIGPGPKRTEFLGYCSQMAVFVKDDTKDDFREQLLDKFRGLISCVKEPAKLDFKDCVIDSYDISDFLSTGVCTYHSYVKTSSYCHNFMPYNPITEVSYPYRLDTRTEEEIIRNETEYKLHRLGSYSGMYYNYDTNRVEIPLYMVTSNDGGEYITADEIRKILEKSNWKIEECEVNYVRIPCVIYEPPCETESSERSETPEINYSTNVNWDSGSNWDVESVPEPDSLEESEPNMDKSIPLTESNTGIWEDAIANTNDLNDESPLSDPCVSSDQTERNFPAGERDERVELLFDSGYQVGTSSVELSPDVAKDWLQEEKREDAPRVMSDSDSVSITESENDDPGFKKQVVVPKGHFIKMQKVVNVNKNKVEIPEPIIDVVPVVQVNRNPIAPVLAPVVVPPPVVADIPIVENGDLANNNRDREGNNYPAVAENIVLVDDNNALREPEDNLDEHNENHIVLDHIPEHDYFINIIEPAEDEDGVEGLENVSREALFDPNSEVNVSEESFVIRGQQVFADFIPSDHRLNYTSRSLGGSPNDSVETFQTSLGFPPWMLYLLREFADGEGVEVLPEDGAHFYSQGDGLGIHPSNPQVPVDDSTTTSSLSTVISDSTIALAETSTHPNSRTSTTSSFHEAEDGPNVSRADDSIPVTNLNSQERNVATSLSALAPSLVSSDSSTATQPNPQ